MENQAISGILLACFIALMEYALLSKETQIMDQSNHILGTIYDKFANLRKLVTSKSMSSTNKDKSKKKTKFDVWKLA
ncbi:hypothetical protein AKO1_005455, partial [Acrasis kona]